MLLLHCMLHVGFRAMHESMTSQKIKKLGAGGPSLVGGQNFWWGAMPPPPAGYGPVSAPQVAFLVPTYIQTYILFEYGKFKSFVANS